MPFLLLLLLALTVLQKEWPTPPEPLTASRSALVTWVGTGILLALSGLLATLLRRQALLDPNARSRVVRRFGRLRRYGLYAHIGWFLLAVYGVGWGWTVKSWLTIDKIPLPGIELVVLTPFLTGLVLSWCCITTWTWP